MKKCSKCGKIKEGTLEFFHRARYLKSGLSSWCKVCKGRYTQNNLELKRKYGKRYSKTKGGISQRKRWKTDNVVKYLLYPAKNRCKKNGIEFNIKPEDIKSVNVCPLLKIPLVVRVGCGKNYDSPSLDRIDPQKGYVKGNVRVISSLANNIKSYATPEQIKTVAKNIDDYIAS